MTHIDKHCTTCGSIENNSHLFFLCDLPQQVWATSNTPISPHLINPDLDGVQHIIPHLFSSNSTEQTITKILLLLWTFGKLIMINASKLWTPLQVHHVAEAHYHTNIAGWGEDISSSPHGNNHNVTNLNSHETDRFLVHFPSHLQGYR